MIAYVRWEEVAVQAEAGAHSRGFADVPFHGMEPVTTVGDMGNPDIFAGGQHVFDPFRD